MNIHHCGVLAWLTLKEEEKNSKTDEYNSKTFKYDLANGFTAGMRRKWQPTPVSCLENSMDGGAFSPRGHKELAMTEPVTPYYYKLLREGAT